MSDITPLATYHSNFRLAFWPDREPTVDRLPHVPEASSNHRESQRVALLASAGDDARWRLPLRLSPPILSFFGSACLP